MQKKTIPSLLRLCTLALLLLSGTSQASTGESVAFYYGVNPPVNALAQFDRLVVESDNVQPAQHRELKRNGTATFAYISVGEVGPHRAWFNLVSEQATFGRNTDWDSKVMDFTSAEWQRLLLQRVNELVNRGYDGLFLDTMDSYQLFADTAEKKRQQEQGLTNLIYRIKRKHPDIRLIANRGFEVVDQIAPYLEAVAAESLYAGWNNAKQVYTEVSENDRNWLQAKLENVKQQHGLDIIAIDYVPPKERSKAREVAALITDAGYIPWVANPSLDYVGISTLEVLPRDVLLIYNSTTDGVIEDTRVHSMVAMPLEYMGYVPQYLDVARDPWPQGVLKGKYAGVVVWNVDAITDSTYPGWLARQVENTVPLALFGSLGITPDENLQNALGIEMVNKFDRYSLLPIKSDNMIGFEAPVPPRIDQIALAIRNTSASNTSHLSYADKAGVEIDAVVTGPWGGLALTPTVINLNIEKTIDWIIDPFIFLKKSLQLSDAPMPDITSENGNRLWFAHIDGDALPSWAELPGRRLGAEVIRDEILVPGDLPHTVSVVEAEINAIGAYADRRLRMITVMRDIFKMDNVESASHTFSHPFQWQEIKAGSKSGRNNLRLPGYKYDLEREIAGSINFIDTHLTPPDKKTKILLWSGDATPPKEALDILDKYGLLNMNGGFTVISKARPSVTAITPNTRMLGDRIQVYAPIMNENVFTNDWTGPFDGFRDVIATFDKTEHPRRIKPINIYYHFYTGTKAASLRSLHEIYDWSLTQETFPVFSSEYIVKVPDFRTAGVARYHDGRWKVSGLGSIRSLRTLRKNSWPDLNSSRAIVGAKQTSDATYFHTNGANTLTFSTRNNIPLQPHLASANAKVKRWDVQSNGRIHLRLAGHVPVQFELGGDQRYCKLRQNNSVVKGQLTSSGNTRFTFTTKDTGDAVIDCQA